MFVEVDRERIRELLGAGLTRQAIAAQLGVHPSTITRYARLLGFEDSKPRQSPFDWGAIQKHYDQGHTIAECREKFGFS